MKLNTIITSILGLTISFSAMAKTNNISKKDFKLKWEGKKVMVESKHYGSLDLKSGSLNIEKGNVIGGSFVIDMNSLKDEDLTDPKWNQKLVGHLKSEDFFDVKKFPESKLVFTKVKKVSMMNIMSQRT